jgi:hypothetical protein
MLVSTTAAGVISAVATTRTGLRLALWPVGRVAELALVDSDGRILARQGAAGHADGWTAWADLHDLRTLSKWGECWDPAADLELLASSRRCDA